MFLLNVYYMAQFVEPQEFSQTLHFLEAHNYCDPHTVTYPPLMFCFSFPQREESSSPASAIARALPPDG